MKAFESLTVIRVKHYCKFNPACFTRKWLTVENIRNVIKCNQLHYFYKVIEKLHYLLHFK